MATDRNLPGLPLKPMQNTSGSAGRYFAENGEPWLKCELDVRELAGRWVRLTYASGILDPLTRPLLRVYTAKSYVDEILNAALFGRAEWTGPIPADAREIWISPTCRAGPFSFRIEHVELLSLGLLLARVAAADPWRGAKCLFGLAIGSSELARLQIRRALSPTRLSNYSAWREKRTRRPDLAGFDAPSPGAGYAPNFRFVAMAPGLDAVKKALASQTRANWSWVEGTAQAILDDLRDSDFIIPLFEPISFPDYLLAVLASEAQRAPDADLLYADEDFIDERGLRVAPLFKPDWSPILQASAPYLGPLVGIGVAFARASAIADGEFADDFSASRVAAWAGRAAKAVHVRRVLATREQRMRRLPEKANSSAPPGADRDSRVCIIIPTRDRVDLLARCIESLRAHRAGADYELLIVDNDSCEDATHRFFADVAKQRGSRLLPAPGPFNYAAICNLAARSTDAPFLVFMNNDIEIIGPDWLARMIAWAARPHIGAVGAKLLYPDLTVQHAGVVLGLDGVAGHFQRGLNEAARGYFAPADAPREVGAVTAACVAIEARKFAAIGGFDDVNLPIEANDLDLCLRLDERGWRTMIEPRARMLHRESASRGANPLRDSRYAEQIAFFRRRWIHVLRDDRYFHPALSLDALDVAIGG